MGVDSPGASSERAIGRFAIERELGRGGMGVVYVAWDPEREEQVALKTLHNMGPNEIWRFKKEFRSLADFRHPNLVRLYELFQQDEQWFFTMELVDGLDFLSWVRPGSLASDDPVTWHGEVVLSESSDSTMDDRICCDVNRLRQATQGLLEGVVALHQRGMVHRDLKPKNVLVSDDGIVKLLDFGLVSGAHTIEGKIVGTPLYMAPEQAAGQQITETADAYALGVMLYEAITGVVPVSGATREVLRRKQEWQAEPPSAVVRDVPLDLDDLCFRLLERDPEERLLPERALELFRIVTPSMPGAPAFCGREAELDRLSRAIQESRAGAVSVLITGASGIGKSELVRHALREIQRPDVLVLRARCYEREYVPYKAFDGIVDALSDHLRGLGNAIGTVLPEPRELVALTQVFPVLRRVPALADVEDKRGTRNPLETRRRAFAGLRHILLHLAGRGTVVLYVDDLQWADVDSFALLDALLRPPGAPRLAFVATLREAGLELPGDVRHIALDNLDVTAARQLVRGLAHRRRETVDIDALVSEAGGHPLFLQELVEAREGKLLKLDDALRHRVAALEPDARRVTEMVAVAGVPVPQTAIAHATGLSNSSVLRLVTRLREARLVRTLGTAVQDAIQPWHDRVREAVSAHLDPIERQKMHGLLADALVALGDTNASALVHHLEAAGELRRAAVAAAEGGRRAQQALAFDQAAELYRTALRLGTGDAQKLQVALGSCLASAGRGKEAADALLEAAKGLDDEKALPVRVLAVQQLLGAGHIEQGRDVTRAVLESVGGRWVEGTVASLVALAWARLRLWWRGLDFDARDDVDPTVVQAIQVHQSIGTELGSVDPIVGNVYNTRALHLALDAGDPHGVACALGTEALLLALNGSRDYPRARKLVHRLNEMAAVSGDPRERAYALLADGGSRVFAGYFNHAQTVVPLAESAVLFRDEAPGNVGELNLARHLLLWALHYRGDYRDLAHHTREWVHEARGRDDRYVETTFALAFHLAWLAPDALDEHAERLEAGTWSPVAAGFHVQHHFNHVARSERALYTGEPAAVSVDDLWNGFRWSLLTTNEGIRIIGYFARARFLLGSVDRPWTTASARQVRALARRLGREPTNTVQPMVALLWAGLAFRAGDRAAAADHLREAIDFGDVNEQRALAAVARYRLAGLVDSVHARALRDQANVWFTEERIRVPAKMARVLAPGFD